jgi:hypothetical protein
MRGFALSLQNDLQHPSNICIELLYFGLIRLENVFGCIQDDITLKIKNSAQHHNTSFEPNFDPCYISPNTTSKYKKEGKTIVVKYIYYRRPRAVTIGFLVGCLDELSIRL